MAIGFLIAGTFVLLSQAIEGIHLEGVRPVDTLWCIGLVLLNAFAVIWRRLIKKIRFLVPIENIFTITF